VNVVRQGSVHLLRRKVGEGHRPGWVLVDPLRQQLLKAQQFFWPAADEEMNQQPACRIERAGQFIALTQDAK
jgi:hypothetical protein